MNYDIEKLAQNRAECMNRIHEWMNRIVPAMVADLETFRCRRKADGSLFKRDKETLTGHLSECPVRWYMCETSSWALAVEFSDSYAISDCACDYFKDYVYLWNWTKMESIDYEYRPHVRRQDIVDAFVRCRELEEQIQENQSELGRLKSLTGERV
tara:strand:+ start:674 stop:1138 length:465 start_codon:yes stop_codon:yes gene_type:complete